ncbi:MAG: transcriptional regulator [Thiothrix sp.]|nr:MAG: transcriptional regulator [Thiothrix sp.]
MTLDELLEQLNIGETQDVEFKKAEGGLPKSIWQTLSALINPNHNFLASDDELLLEQLGGWREDRPTKKKGITLAGLLMFGTERSLQEVLPYYHLDYQEKFSTDTNIRWDDRITIDGTWQPNLYNFYYRTYSRLIQNIKVPFKLDQHATRQNETHVHEALQEALVNTLVHSDHEAGKTITILQYKDAYLFKNAGRLRISKEQLYRGGYSDPRNPALLKMFRLIGLADRAGTGFLKILHAWREQHRVLTIRENLELSTTELSLSLISLMPQQLEQHLSSLVGKQRYQFLDELSRSIILYIYNLEEACNEDLQLYRREHPRDISTILKKLVDMGCLEKSGYGRGTKYRISSPKNTDEAKHSSSEHLPISSTGLQLDLIGLPLSSEHLPSNSEHSLSNSEHSPSNSEHLNQQAKDLLNTSKQPEIFTHELANTKYMPKAKMEQVILELCKTDWRTISELANLLNRKPDSLRNHYINPLLKAGKLQALTPDKRNNPKQAYKSANHE